MPLGDRTTENRAALRAMAHPIRLRIMSLLTGAPLTAAEVARELGISHANASYHLRNLLTGGLIVPAGEEKIRGGVAKRYRYDAHREEKVDNRSDDEIRSDILAIAHELNRRVQGASFPKAGRPIGHHRLLLADADLWIDPETWRAIRTRIHEAVRDLHDAAQPSRTPGTIRTGTTVAMFEMLPPETEN
jgi:DNA-binding transcriptional ArsR family regulator